MLQSCAVAWKIYRGKELYTGKNGATCVKAWSPKSWLPLGVSSDSYLLSRDGKGNREALGGILKGVVPLTVGHS